MRVLVIGGSGFTGGRVLRSCPTNWTIGALARSGQAATRIEATGRASAVEGDLDQPPTVEAALREFRPDTIITVASLGFGHAESLIPTIENFGRPRSVFVSTTGIFTKLSPPSKSVRLRAEELINESTLDSTILRPTMIYGRPGDRNMERLLAWLRRVPCVAAPDGGRALQQPIHVDDLASSIVAAVELADTVGQSINVPGPEALQFSEIVRLAGAAVDRHARVLPVPLKALRAVVAAQERAFPSPKLRAEQIERLVEDKSFDVEPANRLLGHSPRPFSTGIDEEATLLSQANA